MTMSRAPCAPTGVFPRPDNISQTYGGGRNLRPGQPLETEEQQAARQARVGAALARYRQQQGLVVDSAVEEAAQRAFDEGSALFQEGRLEGALERFTEAAAAMNVRTRLGAQVGRVCVAYGCACVLQRVGDVWVLCVPS